MERYFRLHGANGKYWEMEEMEIQGGHGESEDSSFCTRLARRAAGDISTQLCFFCHR